ncbi:MAG: hypothetical protein HY000_09445 [Planctomycetes bacterium]|nr:hypothetical protein [Planctomycetota bacterium]
MKTRREEYVDFKGRKIDLTGLSHEELDLVSNLKKRAEVSSDWSEFSNLWMRAVSDFYRRRGLSSSQICGTAAYRVGQDLDARLAIAKGLARWGDYRDELEHLIRSQFKTRREFCTATGLSEDMLSHVLSGRKHLSIETLSSALEHIGYTLRIVPVANS